MSQEVFPELKGLGWPVLRRPSYDTILNVSPSKLESRLAQQRMPLWTWQLVFNYLRTADRDRLAGFFLSRGGRFESFLFRDRSDESVGPGLNPDGSPNLTAQLQIFQYAGVWYSPIARRMAGFYEDVVVLQPGNPPIQVFSGGAPMVWNVDYVLGGPPLDLGPLHFDSLYVRWITLPDPPVTASFKFFWPVRFHGDDQDFEQFMEDLFTIGGPQSRGGQASLDLISVRPSCEIAPLIMSSCPLPDAVDGAAYDFTFQAALGTGPYTWGISEGSTLPDGLSFNNATGELSGTPTETGVFAFTVNVYDSKGHTSSKSCQLTVEAAPLESACGKLTGTWTVNSRVGPYQGSDLKTWYGCFRDPSTKKKIIVQKTTDYGETWAIEANTYPTLADVITSHDSQLDAAGNIIVLTQEESTGRVAFSRFNRSTDTWDVLNEDVATSVVSNPSGPGVSITQKTDGSIYIAYGTTETISAVLRGRIAAKKRLGAGSWGSEIHIGNWGDASATGESLSYPPRHNQLWRLAQGINNQLHCFFLETNSVGGVFWDAAVQTIHADDSLAAQYDYGLGYGFARAGPPIGYSTGGNTYVGFPEKTGFGGDVVQVIWQDSGGDLTAPTYLSYVPPNIFTEQDVLDTNTTCAMFSFVGGDLKILLLPASFLFGPEHVIYKKGGPGSWSDPADAEKIIASPTWTSGNTYGYGSGGLQQTFAGLVFLDSGILWVGTFNALSTAYGDVMWNLVRESNLPISESVDAWVARCPATS